MTAGRVVHVIRSQGFAGVERYVSDVSNVLAARGWDVAVVGGDPSHMRAVLEPGIRFQEAASTTAVVRALRSLAPVPLVHAHMTAAELGAVLTKPLTRAKVLSTRHFAAPRGASPLVRAMAKLLARGIDTEIAISEFVAHAVEGEPLVLLNGVPSELAAADARRVLVMQRLEVEKDTPTAVRAFRGSGLADAGWHLDIAGRGSQEESLRSLVKAEGLGMQTQFLGFVSDPAALRAAGGIFLAPAPAEPFGLSVVEAMAAGLPVVAADGGAHRETLGETGLFFPPGDTEKCALALSALAASPEQRRAAARAVRLRQQERLTLVGHVDALEAVYRTLLEGAPASADEGRRKT
jgi:glycosyltransferase involved in cell wall biosynthesis